MIVVQHQPNGRVRFQGYAQWVSPDPKAAAMGAVNVGEIEGESDVTGNRFEYESGGCHVVFVCVNRTTIRAEEIGNSSCGGLNVTFAWDDYVRTGPPKFD